MPDTYLTTALAPGIPTFNLARRMGTSLQIIEQKHGHLVMTRTPGRSGS